MAKKVNLTTPIPVRLDNASLANVQTIINSGIAADRSAAIRSALASLARGLIKEPYVWVVHFARSNWTIYGTYSAAVAWLNEIGAQYDSRINQWFLPNENGNPETWYDLTSIIPK